MKHALIARLNEICYTAVMKKVIIILVATTVLCACAHVYRLKVDSELSKIETMEIKK